MRPTSSNVVGMGIAAVILGICSGLMTLAGGGIVGLCLLSPRSGAVPKQRLKVVEGVPTYKVTEHRSPRGGRWYCLECTIEGQTFQHLSSDPRHPEVRTAVESGRPLRAWVAPEQASTLGTPGIVPLYELSDGDRVILDYASVVKERRGGDVVLLITGSVILLAALGGWAVCAFNVWRCMAARRTK